MLYKSVPAFVKAEPDAEGTFEAIVSVFGNVDYMGDRVLKGAFTDTLAQWADKGDPIPVVWSHQSYDPDMNIGKVLAAEERDEGLWVKGQLDLDAPKAAQVFRLLSQRRITQFSFAYDVDESEETEDGVTELKKLTVYEVGPTPLGANPATELLAVKQYASAGVIRTEPHIVINATGTGEHVSAELVKRIEGAFNITPPGKAGRVLSAKNEQRLRDAAQAITDVLAQITVEEEDGKSGGNDDAVRREFEALRKDCLSELDT